MVPGLLKALQSNRGARVADGVKLFEISDVMLLDPSTDVGARNERHLGALYTGPTAGFEVIHGLVDRIMQLLEVPARPYKWATAADGASSVPATYSSRSGLRYFVEPATVPSYFPGRGAQIVVEREGSEKVVVGSFGVLHPKVLSNFELVFPVSVLELNVEPFL